MEIVLVILAFALLIAGIVGAFIPVIPGPPLSYIALLLMQWSKFASFPAVFLWTWAGITIAVTIMDYFLPSIVTKKFGGSRAAIIGSVFGLIAGIFIFPPWGMILGPFLGALAGEFINNSGDGPKAFKIAFGAFLAFIIGSGVKLVVSSLMLFYAVKEMF